MNLFWRELLCAIIGHPGTWVAELDETDMRIPWRSARISSTDKFPGDATLWTNAGMMAIHIPWRCSRCRRTLAEIRNDYSVEPEWLKRLGW